MNTNGPLLDPLLNPFWNEVDEQTRRRDLHWWHHAAVDAIDDGHFQVIRTRDRQSLYLLRCWLTTPKELPAAEQSDGHRWDSADSVLLHFFARGDDDESLHDHPWDFTTRILAGGYVEHLPAIAWVNAFKDFEDKRIGYKAGLDGYTNPGPFIGGPPWDTCTVYRSVGDRLAHRAEDLHCVGFVDPGTWSLDTTHAKRRVWGFHPPGRPWIRWDSYLDERRKGVQV